MSRLVTPKEEPADPLFLRAKYLIWEMLEIGSEYPASDALRKAYEEITRRNPTYFTGINIGGYPTTPLTAHYKETAKLPYLKILEALVPIMARQSWRKLVEEDNAKRIADEEARGAPLEALADIGYIV